MDAVGTREDGAQYRGEKAQDRPACGGSWRARQPNCPSPRSTSCAGIDSCYRCRRFVPPCSSRRLSILLWPGGTGMGDVGRNRAALSEMTRPAFRRFVPRNQARLTCGPDGARIPWCLAAQLSQPPAAVLRSASTRERHMSFCVMPLSRGTGWGLVRAPPACYACPGCTYSSFEPPDPRSTYPSPRV